MSLGVYWDKARIGELTLTSERTREYEFRYLQTDRPISLSLPIQTEPFTPAQWRPFFEALLPEGTVRQQIATSLKLAASDSYGLLAEPDDGSDARPPGSEARRAATARR